MANCKFCGQPVRTAPVFHPACWQTQCHAVAVDFCDNYCRWPLEIADEDELAALHCDSCALIRLLNQGL